MTTSKFLAAVLLSKTGNVNRRDDQGTTPLFRAIKEQDYRMTRYFLRHGASLTARNLDGETPLHCAVKKGNREIVKLLLKHGADLDVNSCYRHNWTPLNLAVNIGDCRMVSLMIKNVDVSGMSKLLSGAIETGNFDMVKLLLEAGLKPQRSTPLLRVSELSTEASVSADLDMMVLLISHGADLFEKDKRGSTVLHNIAVKNHEGSHYEILEFLLVKGLNPNARDCNGATPFHLVLESCNPEVARLFLRYGALATLRNDLGRSTMHFASNQRHPEVLHLLLDNGDSVNSVCSRFGMSALLMATTHGNLEVIKFLLNHGAASDLNKADVHGETPLLALLLGHRYVTSMSRSEVRKLNKIVRLFLVYETDVTALVPLFQDTLLYYISSLENQTWKTFVEYLALQKMSGKPFAAELFLEVARKEEYLDYYITCILELSKAKATPIDNFSVFDFLAEDKLTIANFCVNKKLLLKFKSNWFSSRFPAYKEYLKTKFSMGVRYKKLRHDAGMVFRGCAPIRPLPNLVVEKIIGYLSPSDLRAISRYCE